MRSAGFVIITLLALGDPPCVGALQPGEKDREVRHGRLLYRIHCLNCHGEDGTDEGPTASLLRIEPTDLTMLSRRAGGSFPREAVWAAIDGRSEVRGHGSSEMPIWGLTFQQRGRDTDQEAEVHDRIRALVAYLRSLQRN